MSIACRNRYAATVYRDLDHQDIGTESTRAALRFRHESHHDGRGFRVLTVVDDYSGDCRAIRTERKQNQSTVLDTPADLFLLHGPPDYIRLKARAPGLAKTRISGPGSAD